MGAGGLLEVQGKRNSIWGVYQTRLPPRVHTGSLLSKAAFAPRRARGNMTRAAGVLPILSQYRLGRKDRVQNIWPPCPARSQQDLVCHCHSLSVTRKPPPTARPENPSGEGGMSRLWCWLMNNSGVSEERRASRWHLARTSKSALLDSEQNPMRGCQWFPAR